MKVAGRDEHFARLHRGAFRGFCHVQLAGGLQPLGKKAGKHRRHVLHDKDR